MKRNGRIQTKSEIKRPRKLLEQFTNDEIWDLHMKMHQFEERNDKEEIIESIMGRSATDEGNLEGDIDELLTSELIRRALEEDIRFEKQMQNPDEVKRINEVIEKSRNVHLREML